MAVTTAAEAVRERAPARRAPARDLALVAVAVAAPLLALAVRCALWRGHVFVRGDLALIDLAVRRASHLQQALGPYDRFGWHHPGPAYFYFLALVSRVAGPGLRAQAAGASLINAVALAGTVLVVGRLAGRRAALGSGALLCAGAFAIGPEVMFNPWTPYVVILPLLLAATLAVGAMSGSGLSLAGCVLAATFVVETDVGAGPVAALVVLAGLGGWAISSVRRGRPAPAGPGQRAPALVVVALAGALWLPPLGEQVSGSPGNLSLIARFMTAAHVHAGLGQSLRSVGAAQLRLVGLHVAAAPWGILLPLACGSAAVVLGLARHSPAARRAGALALVGTAVSVGAGALVVGPVYGYLVEWSVVLPLLGGAGVVIALAGDGPVDDWQGWSGATLIPALALGIFGAALLLRVMSLPALGSYSAGDVSQAWTLVRPVLPAQGTVEVDTEDPAGWAVAAGLVDELDGTGLGYTVPAQWMFQYGTERSGPPATVAVALRAPGAKGSGKLLGQAGPVSVWSVPAGSSGSASGRQPGA